MLKGKGSVQLGEGIGVDRETGEDVSGLSDFMPPMLL